VRRRLIGSTAVIALAAVVVLGIPLALVEAARIREDAAARLEREADSVAGVVEDRLEARRPISRALLSPLVRPGHRIIVDPPTGHPLAVGSAFTGPVLRVHAGSSHAGAIAAEAPRSELDHRIHRMWLLIAALSAGGVLTAVALAALQARGLGRPLDAVAQRAAQLGDGDFSVRAGHFGIPEIDAIAQGLDSSAGRIAELVAREREFSANVSHQLRTPLTALRLSLEEAASAHDHETASDELDVALSEADRLETTIAALLAHARQATLGERIAVNLGSVVAEHAASWRPAFARAGRRLEVKAAANVITQASRGTVGQVLDVLLDNALRHGAGTARALAWVDGRSAFVAVTDEGPGIGDADADRIFERGASRTGGTGIGLHLARALAQADGGALRLIPDRATRFELRMPRHAPEPPRRADARARAASSGER
jgi:signal transduction histidine kinase